jgi:rhamnosyltransferase
MEATTVTDRRIALNSESIPDQGYEHTYSPTKTRVYPGTILVLPTLNAESWLPEWIKAYQAQTVRPEKVILVDSASTDRTIELALRAGFSIVSIKRTEFSHGGTRQRIVDQYARSKIVIFLTQDAVLANPNALKRLLNRFEDDQVGAAYGRQLPRDDADPIEAHARLFNYPDRSDIRARCDVSRLGIKTSFISNSFAAWRRTALVEMGGFPDHTIQNEDAWVASKMIQAGWKVAYCADATVSHSHKMTITDEFKRLFDTGVFHAQAPWIREAFGGAGGEGVRFVKSELVHLARTKPTRIGSAIVRTGVKFIAFNLGCRENKLPLWFKKRISSNRTFWNRQPATEGRE